MIKIKIFFHGSAMKSFYGDPAYSVMWSKDEFFYSRLEVKHHRSNYHSFSAGYAEEE